MDFNKEDLKINVIGENDDYKYLGSWITKIIIFLGVFIIGLFFVSYIIAMENQDFDDNTNNIYIHNMKQNNEYYIDQTNFMPILSINPLDKRNLHLYDIYNNNNPNALKENDYDYKKLSKYFKIFLTVNHLNLDKNQMYLKEFTKCTQQHFIDKNYNKFLDSIQNKFCPDMQSLKDVYKIKNGYSNVIDRASFSVDIDLCDSDQQIDCKSKEEISSLLNIIYFTLFEIREQIDFKTIELYGKRPVDITKSYALQFQLQIDQYRDHNNFLRLNKVSTKDSRFFLENFTNYSFFSVIQTAGWIGKSQSITDEYITDEGLQQLSRIQLLGIFYFLDDEYIYHQRVVCNIYDILSNVGGLGGYFILIINFLCIKINYNFILRELIQNVYFPQDSTNKQHLFDTITILQEISIFKPLLWFFKKNEKQSQHFTNLKKKCESQLNLIHIVTRLQRITFVLSELIELPQFEKVKKITEFKFQKYVRQCQDDKLGNYTMFDYIDNFGKIQYKQRNNVVKAQLSFDEMKNNLEEIELHKQENNQKDEQFSDSSISVSNQQNFLEQINQQNSNDNIEIQKNNIQINQYDDFNIEQYKQKIGDQQQINKIYDYDKNQNIEIISNSSKDEKIYMINQIKQNY